MSTYEMTDVQALEPKHHDLPLQSGRVLRREFEYIRQMKSRAAFLSDPTHRIVFHNTPKWMNQIWIWFSILARKLLKCGAFSSAPSQG